MIRLRILFATGVVLATLMPPVRAEVGEHCAYRLVSLSRTGTTTEAAIELIGCYSSYEEALEAGSGGAIQVPSGVTPASMSDARLAASAGASDVLIGTEWDGLIFSLFSTSYFASETCSAQNTWQVSFVGATWNDRLESGKGFGGCDTNKKFEHADFGGAVRTCTPNCADYGALANEVSSLRWKP